MNEINFNTAIYDIALNIGTSLDINETVNNALESYFRQLDCIGIILYQENEIFRSKPKTLKKNSKINEYNYSFFNHYNEIKEEYFKLGLPYIINDDGKFYHYFELPSFGFMLIITTDSPLEQIVSKMLYKLNEKFANSILASLQHHKLLESEKALYQQSKMASMGEMIGNIAHQWRQPLSAISTLSTSQKLQLELGITSNEEVIQAFEKIHDISLHLSHTIEDFRNFFKQDTEEKIFDLAESIKESLKIVEANLKVNNINIVLSIGNTSVISGYENNLKQAFINIINNAKDALISNNLGQKEKILFISITCKTDNIIVNFLDNGGGIPEDILEKIFEPYFTTKHQSQGTGIGLYMTKQIIEKQSHGTIKVSNKKFKYDKENYIGADFEIVFQK